MRHLSLIIISALLTACASIENPTTNSAVPDGRITSDVSNNEGSIFSQYLRDYLAKNINPRIRVSRNFIDRSSIESNGRLPSKALFQSLGYRVRDSFVTVPPELSSRSFKNPEKLLLAKLIQDTETTWALLDSTQARLNSFDGLNKGHPSWEVGVIRRNLLLEAVGYWYQLRNQEKYDRGLSRLEERINELFEEFIQASQSYDVKDQRSHELGLLDLKSDMSLLFQFYSSEQARLYNRIDSRSLPSSNFRKKPNFTKRLSCSIDRKVENTGLSYLQRNYRSKINTIKSSSNKHQAIYVLNEVARDISSKALALHAQQLNSVEREFVAKQAIAQEQRDKEVASLIEKLNLQTENANSVVTEEVEALKNAPLGIKRQPLAMTREQRQYYDAISVLISWTADELLNLNQQRIKNVLDDLDNIYNLEKKTVQKKGTEETNLIRDLLYEVYDFTLIDYLIGYERIAITNKAFANSCVLRPEISANNSQIGFSHIESFANFVESYYRGSFPNKLLSSKLENFSTVDNALSNKTLGEGYSIYPNKKIVKVALSNQDIAQIIASNGYKLSSDIDLYKFVEGDGHTIEVGSFYDAQSALAMVKRFKASVPKIIYLSKDDKESGDAFLKILVGQERVYNSADAMKDRIGFGKINTFSEVRQQYLKHIINDFSQPQRYFERNGFKLATTEEVTAFVKGDGYTIEVGSFNDAESALKRIRRFRRDVPQLIYTTKKNTNNSGVVFKVLIGQDSSIELITAMQGRIGYGDIKTFTEVRSEL